MGELSRVSATEGVLAQASTRLALVATIYFKVAEDSRAHTLSFSHSTILDFGIAPTFVAATLPSLNTISVGIPRTPKRPGVSGLSSIFSFTTETRSPISDAISSSAGPICLHGPHHSAQKSTSTGWPDFSTSASKLSSETLVVATEFAPSEA